MDEIARRLPSIIERLLEETEGAVCDACVAFAADAALVDTRVAAEQLASARRGVERGAGHCDACGRPTVVTAFHASGRPKDAVGECAAPQYRTPAADAS